MNRAAMKAAVITCSTRSARGRRVDESGPLLAAGLTELGFEVSPVVVVEDSVPAIRAVVSDALASRVDVVVTTGGTGLAPGDVTPEAVSGLFDRDVPGIAEALRAAGRTALPMAVLSRAVAGVVGRTLIVTLPGSPGGVRDGLRVLGPVLGHAVDQLHGGDHLGGTA